MKKTVIAVVLCAIAIMIGLSLPEIVSNIKDYKINSSVLKFENYDVYGDAGNNTEFSISDKLSMVALSDNDYVSIKSGNNLRAEGARTAAADFLVMLDDFLEPDEIERIRNESDTFAYVLNSDYGAGASFITWTVNMQFDDYTAGFEIDDESGKVIKFTIAAKYEMGIPEADDAENGIAIIGMMLADYYGVEFVNVDIPDESVPGKWNLNFAGSSGNFAIIMDFNNYGLVINEISYEGDEIKMQYDTEITVTDAK